MNTTPRNPQAAGPNLPLAEVVLTVTKFRDVLKGPLKEGRCSEHQIAVQAGATSVFLHPGLYDKNHNEMRTIRVGLPGAILRFTIQNKKVYHPIGLAFERADGTTPMAVPCSTDALPVPGTPFGVFQLSGATLQIADIPLMGVKTSAKGGLNPPPFVTYKFSVIIQRRSDGAIGIIDPYVENQN